MKKHPVLILTINQHQQGVTTNGSYRAPGKSRLKTRRRIPWQVSWLAGLRLLPTFPGGPEWCLVVVALPLTVAGTAVDQA